MRDSNGLFPLNSQKPLIQLLVSLILLLITSFLMLLVTIIIGRLFFAPDIQLIDLNQEAISDSQRFYIKLNQSLQHISLFLVPSIIVGYLMTGSAPGYLRIRVSPGLFSTILVVILAITIIPLTGSLGVWNSNLSLPQWMSGIEQWIARKEHEAGILTGWLIYSDSIPGLLVNILILALLPAVGEEFLFRGLLQQIFTRLFKSPHLAIVVTAILFSASHMQFYGFAPRLLLGVVFGYLFYWSGSIWLPVMAHFINNTFPVIMAHFIGWDEINQSVQEISTRGLFAILVPVVLSGIVMFAVWEQSKESNSLRL